MAPTPPAKDTALVPSGRGIPAVPSSTVERATTVRQISRACEVERPLTPDDPRWLDLSAARGDRAARKLLRRFEDKPAGEKLHMLFASHRGAGKSTELIRLQSELTARYRCLYFAANVQMDANQIEVEDLLLVLAQGIESYMRALDKPLPAELLGRVSQWFSTIIRTTTWGQDAAVGTEAGIKVETGVPLFAKLFANVSALFRVESKHREEVKNELVDQSLGHGFRLAIVEAANHADREAILADLASTVGDGLLRIAVAELPGADSNLWAALQEPFATHEPRCLALWDFENLGRTDWAHRLNVQRDLFVRDFAVPWLLFIHPASRVQLLQDAPDFCDFAILWVRDERPPVAVASIGMAAQDSLLPAGPSDADNPLLREAQEALEAARFDATRDALARFDLQAEQSVLDRVRREYLGARLEREQGHLAAAEALVRSAGNILAQQSQSLEVQQLAGRVDSLLGTILLRSGRLIEAEVLLRKTLQTVGQTEGLDHPNYGAVLHHLAIALARQGRYSDAERVIREVLDIQLRTLGSEHGAHGASLEVLANILRAQGRYAEAERVIRDALNVRLKTAGREHPAYGSSLHNLACVLSAQDRDSDAERAFHEALAIKERALGREHPDYARSLHGLAEVLLKQERYVEATRILEASLPVFAKAVGQEHFEYGLALHNLAVAWIRQGRYAEAEIALRRGLAILERALGPEHPDHAEALRMFAQTLARQGKYAEAERALRRSLSILEKVFGHEHPRLYPALAELAEIVSSQGRVRDGIRLLERALRMSQAALGAEDPEVRGLLHMLKDLKRRHLRR